MFAKGETVLVDRGVFVASPWRNLGWIKCQVLEDSRDTQTYVVPLPPHLGTPMYVFNRDIKKEGE